MELCLQSSLFAVFGWMNVSTYGAHVVQEDGPGQRFDVGYIKHGSPPPPPIIFTVSDVAGTASM